jgi:acetylornithine deacetylase/succinyl-diaminopimelate desuccinylase-like protein
MGAREDAIAAAYDVFDSGAFVQTLARRVAMPTESQNAARAEALHGYLSDELIPALKSLGFSSEILPNPLAGKPPFLMAKRVEPNATFTVMSYGHGDVIRGLEPQWREGIAPWQLKVEGDRIYGRGTADNKGQHTINLDALACVLNARGALGYNVTLLIEMGEEVGSPGLNEFCALHKEKLRADVFIASDGPRLSPSRPTIFLGSRGVMNFDLKINLREGAHHSGNWGGLLADPGILLSHAITCIANKVGVIQVPQWRPTSLSHSVKNVLKDCAEVSGGDDGPPIDAWWGEPGLTAAEKVYGWNSFAVLAMKVGNPETPVNAIAPKAWARCQLRFVVGTDAAQIIPSLQAHLNEHGFDFVSVESTGEPWMNATRLDAQSDWVRRVVASIEKTSGQRPAILPNLGGSLPNDVFADTLGLPTIWIPHSYAACSQHAPNEHMLGSIAREALGVMAGVWWDLAAPNTP